ncbi:MAG: hypothetical protein WCG95_00130 [bacterium]
MKIFVSLFLIVLFPCSAWANSYLRYGNQTYITSGDRVYSSSGTTYTKSGNSVYGSDGSRAIQSGNMIFVSPPTPRPDYSNKEYCSTIHGKTYCNGILQ